RLLRGRLFVARGEGRCVEVVERMLEARELIVVEALEDVDDVRTGDLQHRAYSDVAGLGEIIADDAAVRCVFLAADEILLDQTVDVSGDRRRVDAEAVSEGADGQAVFVAKHPQQSQLRYRQAVFGPRLNAEGIDDSDG